MHIVIALRHFIKKKSNHPETNSVFFFPSSSSFFSPIFGSTWKKQNRPSDHFVKYKTPTPQDKLNQYLHKIHILLVMSDGCVVCLKVNKYNVIYV